MTLSRNILPFLALLVATAGCGEPTALDLFLVADPNINSEDELVAALSSIEIVIDSPAGLYPGGAAREHGELEIRDVDGDGAGELVAHMDLSELGRLPLIRVEQGGLGDQPLELRLDGLGADAGGTHVAVAAGGVQGVRYDAGAVSPVQVPFNLRASFRPPQVTQVYPDAGAQLASGLLGSVVLLFSKAMSAVSLQAPGVLQLLKVESGQEVLIPAQQIVPGEIFSGGPSRVDYRLGVVLKPGSYRVRVSQGALDTSGRPLDQVPMEPGNQPFSSGFTLIDVGSSVVSCLTESCEELMCGTGGSICPEGLRCEAELCVPEACPPSCGPSMRCDESLGSCVEDCRVHGTYCGQGHVCDQTSGVCSE